MCPIVANHPWGCMSHGGPREPYCAAGSWRPTSSDTQFLTAPSGSHRSCARDKLRGSFLGQMLFSVQKEFKRNALLTRSRCELFLWVQT